MASRPTGPPELPGGWFGPQPPWRVPPERVPVIDETLALPYSIERLGSHYVFRRIVGGVPVEAIVAARKPPPTLRTAYPAWDQLVAITAGHRYQALRRYDGDRGRNDA
ncbi:hypothetical protein [Mycobacterium sp.]|uniref:hypothetical protein n=1 Tax=Mycobacterium sp. TaxID=1785 RepID=UPI0031D6F40E